jgi:hypothetical protein
VKKENPDGAKFACKEKARDKAREKFPLLAFIHEMCKIIKPIL